jgi:hypothetical protein
VFIISRDQTLNFLLLYYAIANILDIKLIFFSNETWKYVSERFLIYYRFDDSEDQQSFVQIVQAAVNMLVVTLLDLKQAGKGDNKN